MNDRRKRQVQRPDFWLCWYCLMCPWIEHYTSSDSQIPHLEKNPQQDGHKGFIHLRLLNYLKRKREKMSRLEDGPEGSWRRGSGISRTWQERFLGEMWSVFSCLDWKFCEESKFLIETLLFLSVSLSWNPTPTTIIITTGTAPTNWCHYVSHSVLPLT